MYWNKLWLTDICSTYPCDNNGQCESTDSGYICTCSNRFYGTRCEMDTDPCANNPCKNNGKGVSLSVYLQFMKKSLQLLIRFSSCVTKYHLEYFFFKIFTKLTRWMTG